jgi:PPOX class probable F420-dependent enzyme
MAREMTTAEWREFVSDGTRTAKLAVVRKNGSPHVVPVWFVLDGNDFVLTASRAFVKGKSLRGDARVALCVDDDRPPFAFVSIRGRAEIVDDPGELLRFAIAIGGRYMGSARAREFGKRNIVGEERLVRVHPTRVIAVAGMTG